ncbi:MAG TPA: zinc ribbon domain-containing protein [Acidimicrobiales bacterium]|nr:zinc ribbon domain-containing protein [Acidimicrobiales bacterium]
MDNESFYVAAVTVIPLLLIAVMATRSLAVGAFRRQPTTTVLVFGLPILGEVAGFAFLFFKPVPIGAAVLLAICTWVGLVSQLALAAWWLVDLIRPPGAKVPVGQEANHPVAEASTVDPPPFPLRRRLFCPMCGAAIQTDACAECGYHGASATTE